MQKRTRPNTCRRLWGRSSIFWPRWTACPTRDEARLVAKHQVLAA